MRATRSLSHHTLLSRAALASSRAVMGFTSRAMVAALHPRGAVHLGDHPQPGHLRWNVATACNRGYVGLLLNWLFHFRSHAASVETLALLADDLWSMHFLNALLPRLRSELACKHVVAVWTGQNVTAPSRFGSKPYKVLMAARPSQILDLVSGSTNGVSGPAGVRDGNQSGAPWVWSDVDAVFVNNPFPELRLDSDDFDMHQLMGEPRHGTGRATRDPRICAGFMAMRNSTAVRTLLQWWADDMREKVRINATHWDGNQNAYRKIWLHFVKKRTVRVRALPGDRFINGAGYFQNRSHWPEALVVHATHISGVQRKMGLFRGGGLWRCAEAAAWLRLTSELCSTMLASGSHMTAKRATYAAAAPRIKS